MKAIIPILLVLLMIVPAAWATPTSYKSSFGQGGLITITSVRRSGSDSVVVKGTIKNTGKKPLTLGNLTVPGENVSALVVKFEDPLGNKTYGPVTVEKKVLGSQHSAYENMAPGSQVNFWTRVTAPPPEVRKVTIALLGDAQPIEDVSIED